MADYAVGSLVRLRSGGPAMTVREVAEGDGFIGCVWFHSDDTPRTAYFRPHELVDGVPAGPDDVEPMIAKHLSGSRP